MVAFGTLEGGSKPNTRDSIGLHLREEGDEVEGEGTAELPGRHDPDRFRKPKR